VLVVQIEQQKFFEQIDVLCKQITRFCADEVQSGYGRSGKFFCFLQHYDVTPDIISIAKGMGKWVSLLAEF
jgi:acetylornithine aminotransferase